MTINGQTFSLKDPGADHVVTDGNTEVNPGAVPSFGHAGVNDKGHLFTSPGSDEAEFLFGEKAFGDLNTATHTLVLANTIYAGLVDIFNGTNADIYISFDGTTDKVRVPSGTGKIFVLKASGKHTTSDIYAKLVSAAASGTVSVTLV